MQGNHTDLEEEYLQYSQPAENQKNFGFFRHPGLILGTPIIHTKLLLRPFITKIFTYIILPKQYVGCLTNLQYF